MHYTIFTDPLCRKCELLIARLRAAGAEVEVLTEETLGAMEDHERRFRLHEQITNRFRTDLPICFIGDVLTEVEHMPCMTA